MSVYLFVCTVTGRFHVTHTLLQNVLGWHQAIPVVTSEWAAVCKRTLQRVPYSEYALPALKDCSVSFTNLDRRDREALKGRVEELGGTVCPDMSKSCTHLVVGNENKASMKRQYVPPGWLQ